MGIVPGVPFVKTVLKSYPLGGDAYFVVGGRAHGEESVLTHIGVVGASVAVTVALAVIDTTRR